MLSGMQRSIKYSSRVNEGATSGRHSRSKSKIPDKLHSFSSVQRSPRCSSASIVRSVFIRQMHKCVIAGKYVPTCLMTSSVILRPSTSPLSLTQRRKECKCGHFLAIARNPFPDTRDFFSNVTVTVARLMQLEMAKKISSQVSTKIICRSLRPKRCGARPWKAWPCEDQATHSSLGKGFVIFAKISMV